jgi:hypothetical protein
VDQEVAAPAWVVNPTRIPTLEPERGSHREVAWAVLVRQESSVSPLEEEEVLLLREEVVQLVLEEEEVAAVVVRLAEEEANHLLTQVFRGSRSVNWSQNSKEISETCARLLPSTSQMKAPNAWIKSWRAKTRELRRR